MTVLHSGTTKKYSENWGSVFGGGSAAARGARPKKSAAKKAAGKKAKARK